MPVLYQARSLFQADPPLLRWAAEARILAREDFKTIGRKCSLLPEAVEAYEQLFFCVLDRLEAETWVACNVIGSKIHTGLTEHDLDVLWRVVGYSFGPKMLDAVIHTTSNLAWPETAKEADDKFAKDAKSLLKRKMAIATHMLPVTPENAMEVLQVTTKLGILDRVNGTDAVPDATTQSPMDAAASQLLSELSISDSELAGSRSRFSPDGSELFETNGLFSPAIILRAASQAAKPTRNVDERVAV
jgi:hypothetical protein